MIILSCTACHGTIAKDIELLASSPTEITFRMATKCPHCKVMNRVEISTHMVRRIAINGKPIEAGTGESTETGIRTL
jgi:phage FluMu protein Com